jgi:hypothetical protein
MNTDFFEKRLSHVGWLLFFRNSFVSAFSYYRFDFSQQLYSPNWELGELQLFGTVVPTLNLSIAPGTSHVTLQWPNSPGFLLEYTTNLNTQWQPVNSSPTFANGSNALALPMDATTKFFRLLEP